MRTSSFLPAVFFACLTVSNLLAQTITFTKTYGSGGGIPEGGNFVIQRSDSGYVAVGTTGTNGMDIYLVKTDKYGTLLYQRYYGGFDIEVSYFFTQLREDVYIIAGYTRSFGAGGRDMYLIKATNAGILWQKTFGGALSDAAYSGTITSDGGYLLAGYSKSFGAGDADIYVVKTDSNGNEIWSRTYVGPGEEFVSEVRPLTDGGFMLLGYSDSLGTGGKDIFLMKIDSTGDSLWTKTYGTADNDYGETFYQLNDGSYLIKGTTYPLDTTAYNKVYLVKADSLGQKLWDKALGRPDTNESWVSMSPAKDGNFIIMQNIYTYSVLVPAVVYLHKIDTSGTVIWSKIIADSSAEIRGGNAKQTLDGGYIITGSKGGFIDDNLLLMKTDSLGNVNTGISDDLFNQTVGIIIYPNPFSSSATLRVTGDKGQGTREFVIYDLLGREVYHSALRTPNSEIVRGNLPAGMYFYKLTDKEKVLVTGKIVIQ